MRKIISLSICAAAFLITVTANTAIPPLSQAYRSQFASDIVTGDIISIEKQEIYTGADYSNYIYRVNMRVTSVDQGHLSAGEMVEFSFWKSHRRPAGWCGRTGQNGDFESEQIRAYMTVDEFGRYELLEPNGFDNIIR